MSEGMYTPPPPPPQPPYQQPPSSAPPPPTTTSGSFDFAKPFTYVFEDPNWLRKVLMGGLFGMACIILIGIPFVLGYYARLTRNIIAGQQQPLPEWDDLGTYFSEGLRLIGVAIVWALPLIVLAFLSILPIVLASLTDSDAARGVGGVAFAALTCIRFVLQIVLQFLIPIALLRAIVAQNFSEGIAFGRVFAMVKANFLNFFLAFLVSFIAGIAAVFGLIACFIGVFFTGFWAQLVNARGWAQAYQMSPEK